MALEGAHRIDARVPVRLLHRENHFVAEDAALFTRTWRSPKVSIACCTRLLRSDRSRRCRRAFCRGLSATEIADDLAATGCCRSGIGAFTAAGSTEVVDDDLGARLGHGEEADPRPDTVRRRSLHHHLAVESPHVSPSWSVSEGVSKPTVSAETRRGTSHTIDQQLDSRGRRGAGVCVPARRGGWRWRGRCRVGRRPSARRGTRG